MSWIDEIARIDSPQEETEHEIYLEGRQKGIAEGLRMAEEILSEHGKYDMLHKTREEIRKLILAKAKEIEETK